MLDQIVQDLRNEGWSLRSGLVDPEHLAQINGFMELHRSEFVAAKVGAKNELKRMESVRGDYTFWLDPLNPPTVFMPLIDFLQELKQRVNAELYLGLQQFECHLAYYPVGTFYQKHSDRHVKDSSRILSFVFYLNEDWKAENGGELVLYKESGEEIKRISPLAGSFVCFLSDEFPHEVKAATRERRSLTGWMHSKIIY